MASDLGLQCLQCPIYGTLDLNGLIFDVSFMSPVTTPGDRMACFSARLTFGSRDSIGLSNGQYKGIILPRSQIQRTEFVLCLPMV